MRWLADNVQRILAVVQGVLCYAMAVTIAILTLDNLLR